MRHGVIYPFWFIITIIQPWAKIFANKHPTPQTSLPNSNTKLKSNPYPKLSTSSLPLTCLLMSRMFCLRLDWKIPTFCCLHMLNNG